MYDLLMQLPMFQGVSVDQMTHILEVIPFDFRTYKVGEVILSGGDSCPGTTFLLSGRVPPTRSRSIICSVPRRVCIAP